MKFYKSTPFNASKRAETDAEDAASYTLHCEAAGYDGALERAQARADAASEMLGRLIVVLIDNGTLRTAGQVANVLQSSYVTVED